MDVPTTNMSVLQIIQLNKDEFLGSTSLRRATAAVTDFGLDFQLMVDNLIETMKFHRIAIGLAAPQVGLQISLAAFNLSPEKSGPTTVLVNPVVTSSTGKRDKRKETCMSVPHYCGEVERRERIEIVYQDRYGSEQTMSARGFLARVIAHEIDHLNGLLYLDRMQPPAVLEPVDLFRS